MTPGGQPPGVFNCATHNVTMAPKERFAVRYYLVAPDGLWRIPNNTFESQQWV